MRSCEEDAPAGLNRDAGAILLVELDGPAAEVAALFDNVQQLCRQAGATGIRVAGGDDERQLLWKGRKAAFGPGDHAADMSVPQLDLGMIEPGYPGHQWHHILALIVNTARAVGCDAIDGPYGDYGDRDGYRESCRRAMLLGCDGKWCIHPWQVEIANETFPPTKEQFAHAQRMLEAYRHAVGGGKGAASLDGKIIDEASGKMAEKLVRRGRAAGMG
ncbi:MAG TPA: FAD-linked oxidase C-terminal domain-containing protein [Egibacteraceae bacterium]|nr:FAD-linked oxidase C-terminal domain-containing protein [Egibacteraceae bacterium]